MLNPSSSLHSFWSPKGRTNRLTYIGILIVLGVLAFAILFNSPLAATSRLVNLPILVLSMIVTARRLHDMGRSGWWALLMLLPILNMLVFLVLAVFPGDTGPNKYGPPQGANTNGTNT
jgi:uncharacterized membrane protein YhaH (DUF805 family)